METEGNLDVYWLVSHLYQDLTGVQVQNRSYKDKNKNTFKGLLTTPPSFPPLPSPRLLSALIPTPHIISGQPFKTNQKIEQRGG